MSSQAFFWVNVGLGLFLTLIFLVGRKGIVAPSKLNLRKGRSFGNNLSKVAPGYRAPSQTSSLDEENAEREVKSLNILFMYNGHSFDAYEVLGAPAGANFQMVQRYYQEAIQHSHQDREFIDAAFFAIQSTQSK
jgi:hypothetical protein